jgi:hypothetical protein
MKKFAAKKLGYGNPKGDFWFIGAEEGRSAASFHQRAV